MESDSFMSEKFCNFALPLLKDNIKTDLFVFNITFYHLEMIFDNSLDKTEGTLTMLDDSLPHASVDRFVFGLQQRKWKEWDILQFTASLRNSHTYAIMENGRLKNWKGTFNEEYATDHNTYFTTAERSMNRIRCTLSGIRKAVTKLCYTSKKQLPADVDAPTVYERSPLLNGDYSPDMFSLDAYGQSVKLLYDELLHYLKTASENIDLCLEVIDREKYMRQHPEEIMEVHDKCYQDTFNHSQTTIKRFLDSGVNTDNDIVNAIEEADDAKETITELFHMLNVDEWNDYVICRATNEARNTGLSKEELLLWGRERREQVVRVRKLLRHLDELDIEYFDTIEEASNHLSAYVGKPVAATWQALCEAADEWNDDNPDTDWFINVKQIEVISNDEL